MKILTCCVTGHRDIPNDEMPYVSAELKREIQNAIADGFTHFISGFADGADLIFAEIVAELKSEYPVTLEAAIPHRKRISTPNKSFHAILSECNIVGIHSEKYSVSCFNKRNRFMVEHSERIIAVYDGRLSGGTFFTINYANTLGKEVKIIHTKNAKL